MPLSVLLALAAASAVPKTSPATWLGPDDYPAASGDSEKEGALTVAIAVDPAGKPSDCRVTASSGDADLDSLTCSLLMKRAEFTPATDRAGQAVSSTYSQNVAWRIPREKLITQGFRMTFPVEPDGRLSACEIVKYDFQDDDLQCTPQMIDAMADSTLPQPLASYRSVSLTLAMEIEQSGIFIPRLVDEDRTVITGAAVDISPAGVVTACKAGIAREWLGRPSDLCDGAIEVGAQEFEPDAQGSSRKALVTFEISGLRR